MISELFKNKNILSPVLMDQITFKVPIYTAADYWKVIRTADERSRHRIEILDNPIVHYFSDPRLYPQNNRNTINPCGRFVVATNGRRVDMAERGQPIPHKESKKRAPQEKSIEGHENSNNKYSRQELDELLANPKCDSAKPYKYQLGLAVSNAIKLRTIVSKAKSVTQFNPPDKALTEKSLLRLELYIEFMKSTSDYKSIRDVFEKALEISFGGPNLEKYQVKAVKDDENEPIILKWEVPQALFSPQFNGQAKWFIKLYDKGDRVRLEIQANQPHLKLSPKEELRKLKTNKFRPIFEYAQSVADQIAECLQLIASHADSVMRKLPASPDNEQLSDRLVGRCQVLFKNKRDSLALQKVARHIAEHEFIDKKTCKELGLNPQCLEKMSDSIHGFLEKRTRGLVKGEPKRFRNAIYVLNHEWLSRTGKHIRKAEQHKPLSFEQFKDVLAYNAPKKPFADLFGSAMPGRKSKLLAG